MGRQSVIVLNYDYSYLNTVSWQKAVKYIVKNKAEILAQDTENLIQTVSDRLIKPLIVRLLKMVRGVYKKKVPFSYKNVMKRDKHTCMYCGTHEDLTVDHVIPKSRGGQTSFENCVTACRSCNHKKGNRPLGEIGFVLNRKPHTPSLIEFLELRLETHGVADVLKEFWK
jgi:5-methylcytosine-specific restriction endonuclease McrA